MIREKMMELAPPSLLPISKTTEVSGVSMFGTTAEMVRTAYEVLGLGALKFTCKGSREVTCVSMENAVKMVRAICDGKEEPVPEPQQGLPMLKMLATFLHGKLDKVGLAHVAGVEGLVAHRGTCPAGSLLYIPTGYIICERTLNGALSLGWRCSIVESPHALSTMSELLRSGGFGPKSAKVLEKLAKELGGLASASTQQPSAEAALEDARAAFAAAGANAVQEAGKPDSGNEPSKEIAKPSESEPSKPVAVPPPEEKPQASKEKATDKKRNGASKDAEPKKKQRK